MLSFMRFLRRSGASSLVLFVTALLAGAGLASNGCGGSSASVDDAGSSGGGDGSTSSDSGPSDGSTGSDGSTLSAACPSSVPADGSACATNGLECEYGSFVELSCDQIATCNGGKWQVTIAAECNFQAPDAAACPATRADVPDGTACTDMGLTCEYATGVCYCTVDHTGAPQVWTCFPTSGCPYPRPRLGETCSTDGVQCDYSTCGASVQCKDGTWHTGNGGCHP